MCTTQSVGMQVYNGFMLNENINQWKWNYQLVKSADKNLWKEEKKKFNYVLILVKMDR